MLANDMAWKLISAQRTSYRTVWDAQNNESIEAYTWTVAARYTNAALIALAIAERSSQTKQPITARELQNMGFTASTVRSGLKVLAALDSPADVVAVSVQRGRSRAYYLACYPDLKPQSAWPMHTLQEMNAPGHH